MNIYLLSFVLFIIIYFYSLSSKQCKCPPLVEGLDEVAGGYCASCDNLTFGQCMKCFNCGFCGNGYKGKCVNGTMEKPNKIGENVFTVKFDKKTSAEEDSCPRYYQNDNFWRYLHLDKEYKSEGTSCVMKAFNE